MTIPWSPVEDTFLVANADRLSYEELSLYLGKTQNAIRERSILLNCSNSTPKTSKVYRICKNGECQRIFTVKKSIYLKGDGNFCSALCEDLYDAYSYPSKGSVEELITEGYSFSDISLKLSIPLGTLYDLYLDYGLPDRDDSVEKIITNHCFTSDNIKKRKVILQQTGKNPMNNKFKGGFKPYLGVSVRSGWENNVLLWLNKGRVKWEYEPQVFFFEEIKRGTRGYTPDIWLPKEKIWIEVKGYLSSVDKTKIKRFKKYYPDEFKKLQAIPKNDKVEAAKFFKELDIPIYAYYDDIYSEYNHLPHWIK